MQVAQPNQLGFHFELSSEEPLNSSAKTDRQVPGMPSGAAPDPDGWVGVAVAVGDEVADGEVLGVGEAVADGEVLGVGEAVADGEVLGVGDEVADGEAVAVGDVLGVGLAVADGEAVAEGEAVADGVAVGLGVGVGVVAPAVKVPIGARLCQVLLISYATKYVYLPAGKVRLSGVNVRCVEDRVVGTAPRKS
ncbi:hypothetical protein GCM10010505_53080 [Kitasatospora aburaviensis]